MICLHPIFVKGKFVPCGKCPVCQQKARMEFANRMMMEKKASRYTYFVTYTLDDEHLDRSRFSFLPFKQFFQSMHKMMRADGMEFSFYLTAEYGSQSKRPHFHAAYFVRSPTEIAEFLEFIQKKYTFGHIDCQPAGDDCLGYICKYLLKDEYEYSHLERDSPLYPFRLFSRRPSIGQSNMDEVISYLDNDGDTRSNYVVYGQKIALNRYIKSHLPEDLKQRIKAKKGEFEDEYQRKLYASKMAHSKEVIDPITGEYIRVNDYTKDNELRALRKERERLRKIKDKHL